MNVRIFEDRVLANQHTATASPPYSQKLDGAAIMYTARLDANAAAVETADGTVITVVNNIVIMPADLA